MYDGKRSYLQATKDACIPFVAQDAMVKYSGVPWNATTVDSGHSPFLSHPKFTADWLLQQIDLYVS
jgi:hypothetical protein